MEVSQPRFTTLNHIHFSNENSPSESASFHSFTRLPLELRLRIWELSLPCRRRLLTLHLAHEDESVSGLGHGYNISIEQLPDAIPQSNVCAESRQAAHQCFRLPLRVNTNADKPLTIWINPERDYLFLPRLNVDIRTFANFIIKLKDSDPKGKGILHIAFDSLCGTSVRSLKALSTDLGSNIPQETITILREWALGLQSLWFIHLLSSESRLDAGPSSGTRNYTIKGLNRSIPIFPHAVEFELFDEDIRPYQPSLQSHTVYYSPKPAVQAWEAMEDKLGIRSDTGTQPVRQISHVLAATARHGYHRRASAEVRCAKTMDDYLQLEQDQAEKFFSNGPGSLFPQWRETEEQKRTLLSAAGFWIFPYGTFDTLDKTLSGKACQNLSDQRPGLGLFKL
ncbi:unnamed protein product [Clonostachys solani]|uniref:2EXR domain-containing protein n=1 Tax=Clonostachys solani TaxID=160281 RepID=A0A9N9W3A4_9HYPO|nr:unnamed protein product [Clonostachys solani]